MPTLQIEGYDITNKDGVEINPSREVWGKAIELAVKYGWQTPGHNPNYYLGTSQSMSVKRAAEFAAAIEKALPDIPEYNVSSLHEATEAALAGDAERYQAAIKKGLDDGPDPKAGLFEFFAGRGRQELQKYVEFFRRGPVRIRRGPSSTIQYKL